VFSDDISGSRGDEHEVDCLLEYSGISEVLTASIAKVSLKLRSVPGRLHGTTSRKTAILESVLVLNET
jgi:hypothetical protein